MKLRKTHFPYRKVPLALADHVEKNNLQGKLKFNLFVGASSGAETENRWARLNMIERRSPHQVGKDIARGINNGNIMFFDKHLSMFPVDLMYGFYTLSKEKNRLDVAIVEASAITEDGGIIPGASIGASPEIIQMADKVSLAYETNRAFLMLTFRRRLSLRSTRQCRIWRDYTISP